LLRRYLNGGQQYLRSLRWLCKMKDWSKKWKASKQPRKQRKYQYNAPLHIVRKMFSVLLSKDLRTSYPKRNVIVKKGDKVKILRGQFKGKVVKVESVSYVKEKVFLDDVYTIKKDGTKMPCAVHPSNLMILELNLDDKRRKKSIERK
jgi:large subunit ribosomal protein L24